MRILQITAAYKPAYIYGGPTMSVAKLSEEIAGSTCGVEVFTTTANGAAELPVPANEKQNIDGVPVRYFKRITGDHSHFSPALLITLWREVRTFDVVHIHAWWNLVSVLSCAIALLRKVPVILSPRGTLSNYSFNSNHMAIKKMMHHWIGKPLLNRCYVHTTAQREQQAMALLLKPKGLFTISNFVSLPALSKITTGTSFTTEIPAKNKAVLRLLFLSRIDKKKGLELLFEALSAINIPYHLSIAGTGAADYVQQLKQLSITCRINNHIDWLGFKNAEEGKFELIAAHDLLVLPSYDENFANVVIESLSMGTAVLLSKQVGLAAYTDMKQLGWICDTNAASIRTAIMAISKDRDALVRIRKSAPGIINEDFKESRIIKEYLDMYKIVCRHE